MKNLFKYFTLMAAISLLASCEDRLDQVNPNEVTTDSYFTDLNETESVITSIYSTMMSHFILNIETETERSDMGYPGWGRPAANPSAAMFYNHAYTSGSSDINNKWEDCYEGIFRANQAIAGLEKLKGTVDEELWTRQMAEAKFFRGFFHYNLHASFNNGEVIIRDRNPEGQAEFNKSVSSSAEVIEFFRNDLMYAYKNLPLKTDKSVSSNLGRVTAGTAATILGNSYLYQGEYDLAEAMYVDVITNPEYGYELVKDMSLLFTTAGELNKESIFEICYNETQRTELSQWDELSQTNRLGRTGNNSDCFMPTTWIAYAYKTEAMDTKDTRNYVQDSDGNTVLRHVPLRASAMCALVEDEDTPYYITSSVSENMQNGALQFAYYKKYSNHDIATSEEDTPSGTGWKSGKNVTVNRLAEVYLNYAECLIHKGDVSGALNMMNAIRARWGLQRLGVDDGSGPDFNGISYTKESLMDQLMYIDKPLELSAEGMSIRWIDMRRWGITKQRFQDLSKQKYYVEDYTFVNWEGKTITKEKASLQIGESPDPVKMPEVYDYTIAAENYMPEVHAYYPLPLNEVLANPNLTSK
ncbi:hypothetical protein BZG02_15655 [Labilibaculum filiforme]|uniref:RagB/SusD family nutrient uptake outer membrane protein n=1 Tax=Labilibaculum filiforme TaxID=1940526 RepID=A0A2N3HTT0_9BACT|nr:RagB/SusD family nutrient uptake outer membrane protein [Labilibaculum filiforme]PKQ61458.1 hypothetical protein BZG02_15655 [Labilibaculum filiforme]